MDPEPAICDRNEINGCGHSMFELDNENKLDEQQLQAYHFMNNDDDSSSDVNKNDPENQNHDPENQEVGINQEVGEDQEVDNVNEEISEYEVPISDNESSLQTDGKYDNESIHKDNGGGRPNKDSMNESHNKKCLRMWCEVPNNLGQF